MFWASCLYLIVTSGYTIGRHHIFVMWNYLKFTLGRCSITYFSCKFECYSIRLLIYAWSWRFTRFNLFLRFCVTISEIIGIESLCNSLAIFRSESVVVSGGSVFKTSCLRYKRCTKLSDVCLKWSSNIACGIDMMFGIIVAVSVMRFPWFFGMYHMIHL